MTTVEIAYRLARHLTEKELTNLPIEGRVDIVTALNDAFQEYHLLSPDKLKRTTASVTLPAPETITLDLVKGSSEFTNWTPTDEQLFSTIRINGDGDFNHRVVSGTELLDTYEGETGTKTATIYGDAVKVYFPIESLITHPMIERNGHNTNSVLLPASEQMDDYHYLWSSRNYGRAITEPIYYHIEEQAVNDGAEFPFLFRVDSLPNREYRLRMEVQMAPSSLSVLSLSNPENLKIKPSHIELILLPLAIENLMTSPLWEKRDRSTNKLLRDKATQARSRLSNLTLQYSSPQSNRFGTPENW